MRAWSFVTCAATFTSRRIVIGYLVTENPLNRVVKLNSLPLLVERRQRPSREKVELPNAWSRIGNDLDHARCPGGLPKPSHKTKIRPRFRLLILLSAKLSSTSAPWPSLPAKL